MSNKRVLVVGTTADYIDIINRRFPQRALFITDRKERSGATEVPPGSKDELLCDLNQPDQIVAALHKHLNKWQIKLSGIACFDCESMLVAAFIAYSYGLSYPSTEAVMACRSKYDCKKAWQRAGLACPDVELVHNASDAVSFLQRITGPAVIKPLTGSGSELVFLCCTEEDCVDAFNTTSSRLAGHSDMRMYTSFICDGSRIDPRKVFVIEEFMQGDEYSCDFTIDGDHVNIIRIAKKIIDTTQAFGTTMAYIVPGELPRGLDENIFRDQLRTAAQSLGLDRSVCMLDFIVEDDKAFLIELSPRPGGDCLPPLLLNSCGRDILGLTLDFVEGHPFVSIEPSQWRPLIGVRLFAKCGGEIEQIDTSQLLKDRRVVELHLKRSPGHMVVLPPEDYESRLLGHLIFAPMEPENSENECVELASKLKIEMKKELCETLSPS